MRKAMSQSKSGELSRFEKKALALLDATNLTDTGKRLQMAWLKAFVRPTTHLFVSRRCYIVGDEWIPLGEAHLTAGATKRLIRH